MTDYADYEYGNRNRARDDSGYNRYDRKSKCDDEGDITVLKHTCNHTCSGSCARDDGRRTDRRKRFAYFIVRKEPEYRLGKVVRSDVFNSRLTALRIGDEELDHMRWKHPEMELSLWVAECIDDGDGEE